MQRFVVRWLINVVAIWVAFWLVPGIDPVSRADSVWVTISVVALIFGLLNATIAPILKFLTCPLIILTLGLGTLVINALMFWLTGVVGQQFGYGFTVEGPLTAFIGALVVSLVSIPLSIFFHDALRRDRPNKRNED